MNIQQFRSIKFSNPACYSDALNFQIYLRRHESFKCGSCFFQISDELEICSHFLAEREAARKSCIDTFENLARELLELDLQMIKLARDMAEIKPTFWDFLEWEVLGDKIIYLVPAVVLFYVPIFFTKLFFKTFLTAKDFILPPKTI